MTYNKIGTWTYCTGLVILFFGVPWYFAVALMCVGITFWDLHDWEIRRKARRVYPRSP